MELTAELNAIANQEFWKAGWQLFFQIIGIVALFHFSLIKSVVKHYWNRKTPVSFTPQVQLSTPVSTRLSPVAIPATREDLPQVATTLKAA